MNTATAAAKHFAEAREQKLTEVGRRDGKGSGDAVVIARRPNSVGGLKEISRETGRCQNQPSCTGLDHGRSRSILNAESTNGRPMFRGVRTADTGLRQGYQQSGWGQGTRWCCL